VVPANGRIRAPVLAAERGCLRAREHEGRVHAVFEGDAEAVARDLRDRLGIDGATCRHVPLEDLFVEILGAGS